ncbi:hypothetical protein [Mesorhizobium sp. LjNodule214]|uniref:hypothetical protein n=1 Tax=Mesorhizobium sp. LjNodule214 TaxID=3342252 RepID=UPI003ECC8CBC
MNTADNSDLIELERRAFMTTSNAMHVWAAYSLARVVKAPVPDWVLTYLDLCARRLFAFTSAQDANDAEDHEFAKTVASAFMLNSKGAGTAASKYFGAKWLEYGMSVHIKVRANTKPDFAIVEVASEANVSTSTVRRAWNTYKKAYPNGDLTALKAIIS